MVKEVLKEYVSATDILQESLDLLKEKGKDYDTGEERSMYTIVKVFNIITSHHLTETEGWLFMQLLKIVRQNTNKNILHVDSFYDDVAYSALKAESAINSINKNHVQYRER